MLRSSTWLYARDRRLGEYSKGMRQKVALIRTLLHDPLVVFLDEPTSAMDPQSAKVVRDSIADLRRSRRTVVLCSHNLAEAEALADRITIIKRGRILARGTADELKRALLGPPAYELRLTGPLTPLPGPARLRPRLRFRAARRAPTGCATAPPTRRRSIPRCWPASARRAPAC